jgi:hypothetical protein
MVQVLKKVSKEKSNQTGQPGMKKEAPTVTITKEEIQETMEEERGHDPEEAKVSVGMINLTQDADAPDPQEFPAAEPQSTQSDSDCEGFCGVCGQHFIGHSVCGHS